jgi:hypothetical protein
MSQQVERHEVTRKRVVYQMPGVDAVTIRRDVEYRATDAGALTLDVYQPPDAKSGARTPAVVFVTGFSDVGALARLGCRIKEMESFTSWAQLTAASGLAAITYTNQEPVADCRALLQYVRRNGAALGIDENRIGVWACSGHVPNALSVLMDDARAYARCAVLCYGFTLDLDGSTGVAEAARQWGFVNPCAGKAVSDLPQQTPLFVVRAGRDEMPHLNEALDRFLARAVSSNLPVTFVNHAAGPHAFDLFDESEASREIVRQILAFLRFHLLTPVSAQEP